LAPDRGVFHVPLPRGQVHRRERRGGGGTLMGNFDRVAPLIIGTLFSVSIVFFWFVPTEHGLKSADTLAVQKAGSALVVICILMFGLTRGVMHKLQSDLDYFCDPNVRSRVEGIYRKYAENSDRWASLSEEDRDTILTIPHLLASTSRNIRKGYRILYAFQAIEVIGLAFGTFQNGFPELLVAQFVGGKS
ncbi:MAG: hypothetical protein ACRCS0_12430, partial [Albidovulum sp.]